MLKLVDLGYSHINAHKVSTLNIQGVPGGMDKN